MPLVLTNGTSHSFSYVSPEDGTTKNVTVNRGQDVEALGLPPRLLQKLASEMVIAFDGERRVPRYTYEDVAPEGETYSKGVVTTRAAERQISGQPGNEPKYSPEELARIQEEAENAAYDEAQEFIDSQAAALADAQQQEREAFEDEERRGAVATPADPVKDETADEATALKAELAELGVKVHPATGVVKLRAKLAEVQAASKE